MDIKLFTFLIFICIALVSARGVATGCVNVYIGIYSYAPGAGAVLSARVVFVVTLILECFRYYCRNRHQLRQAEVLGHAFCG